MEFMRNEKNAHKIAVILQKVCVLYIFLAVFSIVLVLLGRMEIPFMQTPDGNYNNAILFESDHNERIRAFSVRLSSMGMRLYMVESGGKVGFITWLVISMIGIVNVLPMGVCIYMMAKFFKNISESKVFVTGNANILLKGGAVLAVSFVAEPLLIALLPEIVNSFTANELFLTAEMNFMYLFGGAVLIVMAYVFHYGIYLQEEVDYTL